MAREGNRENLLPVRTKEEAIERGRRGGKASGVARRDKKTIRKSLEMLLERMVESVEEGGKVSGAEAVACALYHKALGGDVRAIEVLRDTVGEKPTDKVEHQGRMDLVATLEEARKRASAVGVKKTKDKA